MVSVSTLEDFDLAKVDLHGALAVAELGLAEGLEVVRERRVECRRSEDEDIF